MMIVDNFTENLNYHTYIALGSFDGLHLGHMSLINKVMEEAKINNAKSMVYTFKNHPLTVVNKSIAPKLIMDNKTKLNLLSKVGVDITCLVEFNEEFMKINPEEFIKDLCERFNAKGLVVGFNYRFGYKNAGDTELLKSLSAKYGFELIIMDAKGMNGDIISSSKIRNYISEGNLLEANSMLLQPFMLRGIIISGKKLGKKLGYPTANLKVDEEYLIPGIGVYYTNVVYNNKVYRGITSIGFNPTVNGKNLTIETYILGFNKDIYGEEIELYFIEKTREEIHFSDLQGLIDQLKKDENLAKNKKIYINI